MTDSRPEVLAESGAIGVLHLYGLDEVLTEGDDPNLWATALMRHWPSPSSPDMDPAALRLGIGAVPVDMARASPRSGLEEIQTLCFERVGADYLRVVPCEERPRMSFMFSLATGASVDDPEILRGRMYLDISRPSQGEEQALVHAGISTPPNAGTGETRRWRVNECGDWAETEETVSRWLT